MTYVATPQGLQLALELDCQPGSVLGRMLPLEEARANFTRPQLGQLQATIGGFAMVAGSMDDAIRRGGAGETVGEEVPELIKGLFLPWFPAKLFIIPITT